MEKYVIPCIPCVNHSSDSLKFREENFKKSKNSFFLFRTSMHSSRMRTARLLTVSGGEFAQPWWGLPNLGGLHPGGLGRPPSPVNRMTHRCKNITLPQTSFAGGNKPCMSFPRPLQRNQNYRNFTGKCIFPCLCEHLLSSTCLEISR